MEVIYFQGRLCINHMKGSRGRVTNLFGSRHGFSMRFDWTSSVSHQLIKNIAFSNIKSDLLSCNYIKLELFLHIKSVAISFMV